MKPGDTFEFIDKQKITCAAVLKAKDKRVKALTEGNREIKISMGRLSHIGGAVPDPLSGRDKTAAALKEIAAKRNALAETINIPELWEVLNEEGEWVDLKTMTGLCFPDHPSPDHESAVVRAFFSERRHFKFNAHRFLPYSKEEIRRRASEEEKAARREKFIDESARRLRDIQNGQTPADGLPERLAEALKSFCLFGKESDRAADVAAIMKKTGLKNETRVFDILVKTGVWDKNENLDTHRFGVSDSFPPETDALASRTAKAGAFSNAGRQDLTGLSVMTIDGDTTRDFDDALSLEKTGDHIRLGVHISDVGHFIQKGDAIDTEALSRGSSIYMPDQTISMLPKTLSENVCSLKKDLPRPAITIMATLNRSHEIIGHEIFPSVVAVRHQLTYDQADEGVRPETAQMWEIAKTFREKRLADGAVQINLPDLYVRLLPGDEIEIIREDRESPSRMLVSEIMIMANRLMAGFLKDHDLPAVFRSQPGPKERLYQGEDESLFKNWMQRKRLSRFSLSEKPSRHSGLGLDAYVTATSPIRKYYDLATQRQIRSVFGLEAPYSEKEIQTLIHMLEIPMSQVSTLQFKRKRYWLLKRLEKKTGEKLEALVLHKRRDKYQVLLPEYMMECAIPSYGGVSLKPQDMIRVTVQRASASNDTFSAYMS
ncbi:Exoribonuclease II [Candidatus Desulfarcum epimagneticum]|uniref:Exoribonuclease II n=1 Tax=uncultured Desulfobacteraceae bacterium TaxID=218296 RepID=A0A484HBK5_9BACT|nr:Exoribonuclease II [uncultured Desulfobacteraceae bacterium]